MTRRCTWSQTPLASDRDGGQITTGDFSSVAATATAAMTMVSRDLRSRLAAKDFDEMRLRSVFHFNGRRKSNAVLSQARWQQCSAGSAAMAIFPVETWHLAGWPDRWTVRLENGDRDEDVSGAAEHRNERGIRCRDPGGRKDARVYDRSGRSLRR